MKKKVKAQLVILSACVFVLATCAVAVPASTKTASPLDCSESLGNYTGLLKGEVYGLSGTWYVKNGWVAWGRDGLEPGDNGYYLVRDGQVDEKCTAVVEGSLGGVKGLWYVVNGFVDTGFTGFVRTKVNGKSAHCFVEEGLIDLEAEGLYDGLVSGVEGVYYVMGGSIDWDYTGFARDGWDWKYVKYGVFSSSLTGVVSGTVNGVEGEYYVTNGIFDAGYTGLCSGEGGIKYVRNGIVEDFTGFVEASGGTVYVENGEVSFTRTGIVPDGEDYVYVRHGMRSEETAVVSGSVNGVDGDWYVVDGKVDRTYSGTVEEGGTKYVVVNGAAAEVIEAELDNEADETDEADQTAETARNDDAADEEISLQETGQPESGQSESVLDGNTLDEGTQGSVPSETDPVNYITSGMPDSGWIGGEYMGRIRIPSADINVGLYYCTSDMSENRNIAGRNDSACYLYGGGANTPLIEDEVEQGFASLGDVSEGDYLYIETYRGTYRYRCSAVGTGTGADDVLYSTDGSIIDYYGPGCLCCYTYVKRLVITYTIWVPA